MEKFKEKQNSLEVCKTIIKNHPNIKLIKLISHKVSVNWRQKFINNEDKIKQIKKSLVHHKPTCTKIFDRESFLKLKLSDLNKFNNDVWSMTSKVICSDNQSYHIPMMNFHPYEKDVKHIEESINLICKNYNGVILDSGRYFHYYGNALLTHEEWLKFLADFSMPCILVSPRYIGHVLYRGYCSLRLNTEKTFKPKIPRVIKIL